MTSAESQCGQDIGTVFAGHEMAMSRIMTGVYRPVSSKLNTSQY